TRWARDWSSDVCSSDLMALLAGQAEATGYQLLRTYWQKQHSGADFEMFWRKSLHDGWIEGSAYQPRQVDLKAADFPVAGQIDAKAIEINFRRDPSIWDGRFSNN